VRWGEWYGTTSSERFFDDVNVLGEVVRKAGGHIEATYENRIEGKVFLKMTASVT